MYGFRAFVFDGKKTARKAFDISLESDRNRDRYGRNSWGQSTLLARRLVEAGSTFVTVHCGGWGQPLGTRSVHEEPGATAGFAGLCPV